MTATTQSPRRVIDFPTLTEKQNEIWDYYCDSDDGEITLIGWFGSYGGGKTAGLIRYAIYLCAMYPGIQIIVGRNTLLNLKTPGGTIDQFYAALPGGGAMLKEGGIVKRKVQDNLPRCEIQLPGWDPNVYSTVYFRGMDDDTFFKSAEIGAVLVEEADGVNEDSWKYAISRLRQRLPDGSFPKYLALAVANPSISWVKEWFIDDLDEKQKEFEGAGRVKYFKSLQSDNPYIPPNYEAMLRATLDDEEIQANVEGSFESFRGRIFGNFSPETHGIHQTDTIVNGVLHPGISSWHPSTTKTIVLRGRRFVIPKFKYAVGGLDFAGATTKAHLSTGTVSVVDEKGRDYMIDCFADNGPGVHQRQKQWMMDIERALGLPYGINWCADGTQAVGISYLTDLGFHVRKNTGGNDSWQEMVHFIRDRFMLDEDGLPQSFYMVSDQNRAWVREIQQYRTNMKQGPDGTWKNKPIEKDDDRFDAYRYEMERLKEIQRQMNPAKFPKKQAVARKSSGPLSEFDSFMRETQERRRREQAYELAKKARQNTSVPA